MNTETASAELAVYRRYPVEITGANGVELETADGHRLLDFYGGHATTSLGHSHPALVAAITEQAKTLFFQTNAVELAVRERAARGLVDAAPGLARAFFVNSGAEANENALRVACRATGRDRVVAFEGGFHGRTAAAAACTDGHAAWYGFPRTPFDVTFVPVGDRAALDAAIDDRTAAVILEPVQGMAGAIAFESEYLREVRTLTRERGALLIADEIQCGIGRTGTFFAIEASGVEPDLLTAAKGIAGGFPCGALLLSDELAKGIDVGDLGTTFGGGPLACALVEAVTAEVATPAFLTGVRALETRIRETCLGGVVQDIQGRGLLLGLRTTRRARDVVGELLTAGILTGGARDPHIVRLLPPLTIDDSHVARLAAALEGITP